MLLDVEKNRGKLSNSKKAQVALIVLAVCIIAVYLLPYLFMQESAHLLIHDNLDSIFVRYKLLAESGQVFSPNHSIIEPFMGGTPRSSFPLEFSFTTLWFCLLPPLQAYILERGIQAFVAFFGMYFLLRKHLIPGESYSLIQTAVALGFALLPFWPFGGLSVAGLPLLLYAFLNLRSHDRSLINWVIIGIFPFYASLMNSGVFFIFVLVSIILYDGFTKKRFKVELCIGIGLLCLMFILTHYRLFHAFVFDSTYTSHRTEMIEAGEYTIQEAFGDVRTIAIQGRYHAASLHDRVILPTIILAGLLIIRLSLPFKFYLYVLAFLAATSLFYGFWKWEGIQSLIVLITSAIPINLGRFHWLHPMLWTALFGYCLALIQSHIKWGKLLVYFLVSVQIVYCFSRHELRQNQSTPSYEAFFAEEQFAEIKAFINQPLNEFRVVSIGIHPSVALYNGFYTLDGYVGDYPLEFKHEFGQIIRPELDENAELAEYFDTWGSRAYIFVDELGINFLFYKNNPIELTDLDLNLDQFQAMGGVYILSAVRIDIETNPEYEFLRLFVHSGSAWDIYLYRPAD